MAVSHLRQRTCIANRSVQPETELLRTVLRKREDGQCQIIPDPARRLPGRGAWITPNEAAVLQAQQRRAFNRAFKVSTPVDAEPVLAFVRSNASEAGHVKKET